MKWDQNHSSKFDKKPQKPRFHSSKWKTKQTNKKVTFRCVTLQTGFPFPAGDCILYKKICFCFCFYFYATIIFGLIDKYRGTANGTPSKHCRRRRMQFLIILTTCWFIFFPLDISMNLFFLGFNNSQMQPKKHWKSKEKIISKKGDFFTWWSNNKLWITSLSNFLKREMMNLRFIAPVWPFHLRNNRQITIIGTFKGALLDEITIFCCCVERTNFWAL